MPTYEYECEKCSHKFEQLQKITDGPLRVCPKCGGKIDRLIGSGGGFIFKGPGFYVNDYKNKGKAAENKTPQCPKSNSCKDCSLNNE